MNLQIRVLLLASIGVASALADAPFEVSREAIAAAITNNIRFYGELSTFSATERAAYLQQLDVAGKAARRVPKTVFASSRAAAELILRSGITHLRYDDMQLNRLTVEKAVMDAALAVEQTRLLPSLDESSRKGIEGSINRTLNRARTIVIRDLSDVIPGDLIEKATQQLRDDLVRRIDDITTYAMKQKPDTRDLDRLLDVFQERLELSKQRAVVRLERLEKLMKDHKSEGDAKQPDAKRREMERIIDEVLSPLRRSLLRATSPPGLLELNRNPDRILAGYSELVKQWSQRLRTVSSERFGKGLEEQRRKQMLERMRFQSNSIADTAIRDLVIDTPPQFSVEDDPNLGSQAHADTVLEHEHVISQDTTSTAERDVRRPPDTSESPHVSAVAVVSAIGVTLVLSAFLATLMISSHIRQRKWSHAK
jgi:hypothetical protein